MQEFAKHLARPAIPQNTGGPITPRHFPAITQTGQSIKLVPMGTLPQSNQPLWVLDHADGSDGACLSALPLSFIEKCATMAGTRYWRSSDSSVARSSFLYASPRRVPRAFAPARMPVTSIRRSVPLSTLGSRGLTMALGSATIEVNKDADANALAVLVLLALIRL